MTPGQLSMLIKVLNLTTSPNDAEALAAARKANDLLKRGTTTWEALLNSGGSVVAPDVDEGDLGGDDNAEARAIDEAFQTIFAYGNLRGSFEDFINSLHEQWQHRRSLSPRQKRSLFEAAERERGKR